MAADTPTVPIIVDTREQQPWKIDGRNWAGEVLVQKLDTGDYSLAGLTHLVVVERKKSVSEIAQNLFDERFERELGRMEAIAHPFVYLDFPFSHLVDYPRVPTVPYSVRRRIRLSGKQLLKRLNEFQLNYKAKFVCTEGRGRDLALSLFKRVIEKYGERHPAPG
jgi:ERCC4-type nuclease